MRPAAKWRLKALEAVRWVALPNIKGLENGVDEKQRQKIERKRRWKGKRKEARRVKRN
jgi:hypothetical protein